MDADLRGCSGSGRPDPAVVEERGIEAAGLPAGAAEDKLNYTTVLNIVFLALAALLVWRYFLRGGGLAMLRMMERPMAQEHAHEHGHA